jgi:NAD(P)-dependent dehydrogenase (short-subunit alcohol dehydrogenase family)
MKTRWTTKDIPDQTGRTAIVTGASSGLGRVVAQELARAGAQVILAVRDVSRSEGQGHEVRRLDLSDLRSVRDFAEAAGEAHPRLDLLVNCAGVMGVPRTLTAEGHEMQLAVNHLGHFALTALLYAPLAAAGNARVVTVTSVLHAKGHLDFDDLQAEHRYRTTDAYNRSKLANAVFGLELHRRLTAAGSPVSSVLAHPGYARTNLQHNGPTGLQRFLLTKIANPLVAMSAEQGALSLLYAATEPATRGGELIAPDGLSGIRGYPAVAQPSAEARDPEVGRRLWTASEELTGVSFTVQATV